MVTLGLRICSLDDVSGAETGTIINDGILLADNGKYWDDEDDALFDAMINELHIRKEGYMQLAVLERLQDALDIPHNGVPAEKWRGTMMEKYARSNTEEKERSFWRRTQK